MKPTPLFPGMIRCCLALLLSVLVWRAEADAASWAIVRWVADGDTVVLADGRHVRYIGIDTPEIDHENQRAEPMGREARSVNRQLVENRRIRLEYDRERKDRYGRVLAYVYRSDGLFVNAELLRRGCGHVLYHFPNTARADELLEAQRYAMEKGRGIWKRVEKTERPAHAYVGNRRSRRFHAHGCPNGARMSPRNRVRLPNQWEAFWRGYAPARECIVFPPEE